MSETVSVSTFLTIEVNNLDDIHCDTSIKSDKFAENVGPIFEIIKVLIRVMSEGSSAIC